MVKPLIGNLIGMLGLALVFGTYVCLFLQVTRGALVW